MLDTILFSLLITMCSLLIIWAVLEFYKEYKCIFKRHMLELDPASKISVEYRVGLWYTRMSKRYEGEELDNKFLFYLKYKSGMTDLERKYALMIFNDFCRVVNSR